MDWGIFMDSKWPNRKSIRLPGYDYRLPGSYFITICTYKMKPIFGRMKNGVVMLNYCGTIALSEWFNSRKIRKEVELREDEIIIMPNHLHVIIHILDVGATGPVARPKISGPASRSIGAIIGQFKSQTTKRINIKLGTPGLIIWQRGFYDRVIRNADELNEIRLYIQSNPDMWRR